ncbi:PEP-CTERM sorting domain-containing protein [Methylomonas sp. TEB]|uniref:PEP-CTERM sorting domain-containing protein n=1 Tax=Methylomonas sp. TEB TaxID=3398229 RepID=UPI0039F47AA8
MKLDVMTDFNSKKSRTSWVRGNIGGFFTSLLSVSTPTRAAPVLSFQAQGGVDISNLSVGQSFGLDIVVSNISSERYAYIIGDISFNPAIFSYNGRAAGSVIPSGVNGAAWLAGVSPATVLYFGAYGGYNGESGRGLATNGVLGTLFLTALTQGSGQFVMSNIEALDDVTGSALPITGASALDYSVDPVTSTVPEPTTLSLMLLVVSVSGFRWLSTQRLLQTNGSVA